MQTYIPYEKRSKKEKRRLDSQRRTTWGPVNPVTRKPENSKAYNRTKARNWKRENQFRDFYLHFSSEQAIIQLSIRGSSSPHNPLASPTGAGH